MERSTSYFLQHFIKRGRMFPFSPGCDQGSCIFFHRVFRIQLQIIGSETVYGFKIRAGVTAAPIAALIILPGVGISLMMFNVTSQYFV